jgi:hypothetical protein
MAYSRVTLQPLIEDEMNRSQAVSAGVWYNPTPEQRRELKERAAAMRSPQRRKVQVQLRLVSTMGAELRAVRRMLDNLSDYRVEAL